MASGPRYMQLEGPVQGRAGKGKGRAGQGKPTVACRSAATFAKYRCTVALTTLAAIGEEPNGRERLDGSPPPALMAHPPTLRAMPSEEKSLAPRTCSSPYGFRLSQADLHPRDFPLGMWRELLLRCGFYSPPSLPPTQPNLFCLKQASSLQVSKTARRGPSPPGRPSGKGLAAIVAAWHAIAMGRRNLPTSEPGGLRSCSCFKRPHTDGASCHLLVGNPPVVSRFPGLL